MDMQQVWGNAFNEWRSSHEEHLRQDEGQEGTKQSQIQKLPPLPWRAPPSPWEDLASVLSRTARIMGYAQPQWLLRPEAVGHRIDQDSLPVLYRPLDSLLLSRLLHLEEKKLYSLTLHRFASRLAPPHQTALASPDEPNERPSRGRLFLNERDRRFFLANRYTQVCPRCLDEYSGYDRLYWRCDLLLFCPRHHVFLVRHCPTCHARIPAFRPLPTTCPTCQQGDYRSTILGPQAGEEAWLQASHTLLMNRSTGNFAMSCSARVTVYCSSTAAPAAADLSPTSCIRMTPFAFIAGGKITAPPHMLRCLLNRCSLQARR